VGYKVTEQEISDIARHPQFMYVFYRKQLHGMANLTEGSEGLRQSRQRIEELLTHTEKMLGL